ncbi:MAG: YaaR family protein [Nitrospirae bacterium]|nr:YaaR family protein [Nitrospirota bacterium]
MEVGKVRRGSTAPLTTRARVEQSGSGESFTDLFNQAQDQELRQDLQQKMKEIDVAADGLRKDINQGTVSEYKSRVKDFVEMIAKRLYTVRGKGVVQTMKVIDTVNTELEELTRIAMEGQAGVLRVVQKIDEIRGLLLDLYS